MIIIYTNDAHISNNYNSLGINSAGVGKIIQSKRTIQCACIGTFFKLPITYVTLAENAIMALMAIYMISML